MTNEAFARVKIDALLSAQGWGVFDTIAVRFEVQLADGTRVPRSCQRADRQANRRAPPPDRMHRNLYTPAWVEYFTEKMKVAGEYESLYKKQ